ncbi:hypothetical protein BRADI_2g07021v3 [Brachypodium distachyon]|uniref:Uncharacterized protein n=1 Tax=Brachypodium distachyon TaxID=15368 RepID=A0A0Q3FYA8_BRADI|nr:hypothetical protein BRADI_2g07021v3 [Brachypodium distachyon]
MARGADPDYIGSLLLMDGFDMGIRFDGFGENMKKIMELPIKYLDSAHDKAVGLVEDIQAMIYAPFPDDELPNEGQDPSSNSVVNGSSTTSVEVDQINSNEELSSSSSSLITAEDISLSTADNDPHETESVSSKNPDLRDGEEQMKNNKAEASSVPQPKNASFKKIVMRSLSNKLRWSKKTSPIRPQDAANVHYEVISSSEDLEHDWELL